MVVLFRLNLKIQNKCAQTEMSEEVGHLYRTFAYSRADLKESMYYHFLPL